MIEENLAEPGDDAADGINRRDFLQVLAASFAALATSGCSLKPPVEKVIPSVSPAEGAAPGNALWYATTCGACSAACGAMAKVRDGRPIKLEGNPEHPGTHGGLCARGQASVLDLYDSERFGVPLLQGGVSDWDTVDLTIIRALEKARASGRGVRLLTGSWSSPTARVEISRFMARYKNAKHVSYDDASMSAALAAHHTAFGVRALPTYRLEKAKVLVSFDADFLGEWGSPVTYTKAWAINRRPDPELNVMSRHIQFEARMSMTGANADLRVMLKPSERFATMSALGRIIAQKTGWDGSLPPAAPTAVSRTVLIETAEELVAAKKRALLLCGSADPGEQLIAVWINHMIGAYGQTADLAHPSRLSEANDAEFSALLAEMRLGGVAVLVVRGCNPAQDHPRAAEFREAAKQVGLLVCLAGRLDETTALAGAVCPEHHALETWADHDAYSGVLSLTQPTIAPMRGTRDAMESLARWSGRTISAYELVREHWRAEIFTKSKGGKSFEVFWSDCVRDGYAVVEEKIRDAGNFSVAGLSMLKPAIMPGASFEFVGFSGITLGSGAQANNAWLQELPDPVTKVTWGNVASFSPLDAKRLGLVEGRVVRLTVGSVSAELPAYIQPGQAPGTVAAAVGYGRVGIGRIAGNYPTVKMLPIDYEPAGGADVRPLMRATALTVVLLDRMERVAKTQRYDYLVDPLMGEKRPLIRETTLPAFITDARSGNEEEEKPNSLWPGHKYEGHRWGMAVDLNSCTGCSACVLSCNVENNVPVVGRVEVSKSREMHWLRIDRYYSGPPDSGEGSPEVAFQPMLCQHCGNAPCETVCPVAATVHSTEGLNMQVYNRCVGTRYCANNCPYKVRRFNWFDYAHEDLTQNLALNPDVTVRTRGIMEKCTFCVQRIYGAKADAKVDGRPVRDGEIKPACAQSCPAEAIVFGDLNDPKSRVAKVAESSRSYRVLSELGVDPSIRYLVKVRNTKV